MSEKKTTAIKCPCGKMIDEAFYPQHVESGHTLHVIEIKGIDPTLGVVQTGPKVVKMLDIPYLGRVRRDAFIVYTFINWAVGIAMAAYAWRII